MANYMSKELQNSFIQHLHLAEKSRATIGKYAHDVAVLAEYMEGEEITRERVLLQKSLLEKKYAVSSANSMIAAWNAFFRFCGWHDLILKQFRVQRDIFYSEDRELTRQEYFRLLRAAEQRKDRRLALILQTICGTGIRVSELSYITVEAAVAGEARVHCKGKIRRIMIVPKLRAKLLSYAKRLRLHSGMIFVTKAGKPIHRTVIWREMKSLCRVTGVLATKVFPHNLRHLFARVFYSMEKDIVALADILGHASINTTRIYTMASCSEYRRKLCELRLVQ